MSLISQVKILSRSEWGALPSLGGEPMETPIHYITLSYLKPKKEIKDEAAAVRSIQQYHIENLGYTDIQSNFLIGKNGTVYEGRGWFTSPNLGEYCTQRQRENRGKYLELSFIDNYKETPEKNQLLLSASKIIREGLRRNLIEKNFRFLEEHVIKTDGSDANTVYLNTLVFSQDAKST